MLSNKTGGNLLLFLCFKHRDLNQNKISAPNMLITILELHIKIDIYIHCTFTEMWQIQSSLPTI